MNKQRSLFIVTLVLLMSFCLSACNGGNGNQPSPSPVTGPIKLGGTLPLTGPFSGTAEWIERGYHHWAAEINAQGGLLGRQVELIIYDDTGDPNQAVELLEKVILEDSVDLVLGGYPGTSAALQMPVAENHKKVYVSMGGHLPSFEQGFTYSFGGPPLMGQWWYEGFWQWAMTLPSEEQPKKLAMITLNNVVGLSVRGSALDGASRMGMEIVVDEFYDLPLDSAEDLVAMAKATDADLFLANGFLLDGIQTVHDMKKLDYTPKFFLQGVGSLIPDWTTQLGEAGNYVFSGTAIHPKLPFEGIETLNAFADSEYGTRLAPSYFLYGYAWVQTLQFGVEGAGSLAQEAIRDYLKSHSVSTVGGEFTFDARGLPEPYSYLTQIQPSGVELIWPLEVQTADPVYPHPAWEE